MSETSTDTFCGAGGSEQHAVPPASGERQWPQRRQLRRTSGWRVEPGSAVVARGPGRRWGNPWQLHRGPAGHLWLHHPDRRDSAVLLFGDTDWRALAAARYEHDLVAGALAVTVAHVVSELAGRHLYCWCPADQPCHGDVLLAHANQQHDTAQHDIDQHGSGRPIASTSGRTRR